MKTERKDFDSEAAAWDEDPGRVKVAADIARAIMNQAQLTSDMDVLDFGCGTGLISLALQPFVRSVTGMDGSRGMLDVLRKKISIRHIENVNAVFRDPGSTDALEGSYDLVVCSMTLHHVRDVDQLLRQFHQVLNRGGLICIADLDPDDGQFHAGPEGVFHAGFSREGMQRLLADAGFRDIRVTEAARIEKAQNDHPVRLFTVFLMTGRKPH